MGGEPSHDLSPFEASADFGASDRTPKRVLLPITVSAGTTALFPIKVRFPRWVDAIVIQPPSMCGEPSEASSAIVDSSSISIKSGVAEEAVESSTFRPIFAPSKRYHGAR